MAVEKEKTLLDFVKLVSPGTALRNVVDDLVRSDLGALIVFDNKELQNQKLMEGGFRINCRFTSQKLFELCKMDGAIVVSSDLKRILYANVLMTPDGAVPSIETGTRHKAGERIAKQAHTLVIAVSERRKKTTLYYGSSRHYLKSADEIIRNITPVLQVLEKQRETLNEHISNLNILEMSDLVSAGDVCNVIQRAEMILKTSESIKKVFAELGKEGNVMQMRYRELTRGIEKIELDILKDYAHIPVKRAKTLLSNLNFDSLLDLDSIARFIFEKTIEESVSPRGYRFLSHLPLSMKEISQIVSANGNLDKILRVEPIDFEDILKNRANGIYEEIRTLREQVLSGKVIC